MSKYANAIWAPTPKHGYPSTDIHDGDGVVIHSAEGSLSSAQGVLAGPREASWHFFVCKDGRVFQHVDTANIAWTNGSFAANKKFWGIENEGMAGEPLTEPQFQSLAKLVKWLLGPLPHIRGQTLWEHNEMTAFGALPTACPSNRIPWTRLIAALKEEDMALTEADKTIVKQIIELYIKHDAPLFKDNVNHLIRAANIPRDQADAALKAKVDAHVASPHAGLTVPPLKVHIPGQTVTVPAADYDVVAK